MKKIYLIILNLSLIHISEIKAESLSLKTLLEKASGASPILRMADLEQKAQISKAQESYKNILPEFGVEGGARSSREREKRDDQFYYAYGKWSLSFQAIQELRSELKKQNLAEKKRGQLQLQLKTEISKLFYSALYLQKHIQFKEEDFKYGEKQMAAAQKRVDGGLATPTDILEFQFHQQEISNDLLDMKHRLKTAISELCRLVGISGENYETLDGDFIRQFIPPSFEEADRLMKNSNIELATTKTLAEATQSEKLASLGEWMPVLSAEAQYGKLIETDFIESRKNSWELIGKVTIPLFQGFKSHHNYQAKSAEAERANIQHQLKTQELNDQLVLTFEKIKNLNLRIQGEERNLKILERYYESVLREYKRGVKNSPDIANATDKLFNARSRLLSAEKDLVFAKMDLDLLQGIN